MSEFQLPSYVIGLIAMEWEIKYLEDMHMETGRKGGLFQLVFRYPDDDIKGLNTIAINVSHDQMKRVIDLHAEHGLPVDGMGIFNKVLSGQLSINLDSALLTQAGSGIAVIGNDSKLKLTSEKHLPYVLSTLYKLFHHDA